MDTPPMIAELQELGRQAYESGHLSDAVLYAEECLSLDSDNGKSLELFGLVEYSAGRYKKSVSALEAASLRVPLSPAAHVCLAHGYGHIDRRSLSCDLLNTLIDNERMSIPLLLQIAAGLDAIERPNLSMRACRKVIEQDEFDAQAHYDLSYYAGRCGYPDQLVATLARKAINLAPNVARYRVGLAGLLYRNNHPDEAYWFICDLPNDDLVSIGCVCCLKRITVLYERAHDYRRVVLCQQRLLELEFAGGKSDCQ